MMLVGLMVVAYTKAGESEGTQYPEDVIVLTTGSDEIE